ncbi:MAG: M20/M25/M40 family metallo-hydrolase [Thermoanaerobaculia bacterium]|jgi:acetylornithine deacetylase/succinyl-diaminopimelate desuccinylase-like protein
MYLSKKFAALPPHQKLRRRVLLHGSMAVLVLALVVAITLLRRAAPKTVDDTWQEVDLSTLPEVQLLQDYIRVDTSASTGSEIDGALFLADKLRAAGIEPHIERLGEKKANLWAILEGESPEALVLHSHIDVFDVEDPEEWVHPPYGGVIDRAWIYGRGVFDMKSVAIAQLEALIGLKKSGKRPAKSVIFLATGSEEVGSELGARWVLAQHPELVERFWVVLTEGGVVEAVTHEEVKYWGIEFGQKQYAEAWACSSSRERLEQLAADIDDHTDANFELRQTDEVLKFLSAYAASRDNKDFERILADTRRNLEHPMEFFRLPPYLQALFREDVATFWVEEAPGGGYRLRLIVHLLPGSDFDEVRSRLLPDWITHGVALTQRPPLGTDSGSPIDHPAFEALAGVISDRFPDTAVGPYFLVWSATDARFFRQAGIPSYGFSPFLIFTTDTLRKDTLNERLGVTGFVGGVELYKEAVQRLAG